MLYKYCTTNNYCTKIQDNNSLIIIIFPFELTFLLPLFANNKLYPNGAQNNIKSKGIRAKR